MEYRPPISTRETEQLLAIVEAPEDWKPDALEQARRELISRGIAIDSQLKRKKSVKKYKRKSLFIKGKASYSTSEFILLIILSPLEFAFLHTLSSPDHEYKKMNRQFWLALVLGIGLWFLVIYLIFE